MAVALLLRCSNEIYFFHFTFLTEFDDLEFHFQASFFYVQVPFTYLLYWELNNSNLTAAAYLQQRYKSRLLEQVIHILHQMNNA